MASASKIRIKIRKKLLEGRTDEAATITKQEPLALLIVIEALEDPREVIRRNATITLSKADDKSALKFLPDRLNDPDPSVQWSATSVLALLGYRPAIERLCNSFGTEYHDEALTLINQVGIMAVDTLVNLLTSSNEDVRVGVVQALGAIDGQQTIEPLIRSLGDDSTRVRDNAASSLVLCGSTAIESLIIALKDPNPIALKHKIKILIQIGNPRVISPLIQFLGQEEGLQQRIQKGLLQFDSSIVIQALIDALISNDENICRESLILLWTIGENSIEPIINAMKTKPEKIRLELINILAKIGDSRIKEALYIALTDPSDKIRKRATESLGEIDGDLVVESLIKALQDKNKDVRASAAISLMNIGDRRAVKPLVVALQDPYREVRRNAAKSLLKMPREADMAELLQSYQQYSQRIDENTIEDLIEIGDSEAVEFLIALSNNKELREKVITALLVLEGVAVDPLIQALEWNDKEIQCTAAYLLGKIGNRHAIKPLIRLKKDQDQSVRTATHIALQDLLNKHGYSSVEQFLEHTD